MKRNESFDDAGLDYIVNFNPDDVYAQRAIDRILADDRDFDATANTALQNRNRAEIHYFSAETVNRKLPTARQPAHTAKPRAAYDFGQIAKLQHAA